jgi:hypothetical protein
MHRLLGHHSCAKNGELLRLAETEFDLFITSDQNIRYQQNLAGCKIAVLELSTNDIGRIEEAASVMRVGHGLTEFIQIIDFARAILFILSSAIRECMRGTTFPTT